MRSPWPALGPSATGEKRAANFVHYTMKFYVFLCGPDVDYTKVFRILRRMCASVRCQGDEQVFILVGFLDKIASHLNY